MENQQTSNLQFNMEEPSQTKKILKIEVPSEEINQEFNKTFKVLQKRAKIPGFRKGKVPVNVIRNRMGREVADDILQRMIPHYYTQALAKSELQPVDMPMIGNVHLKEGDPFRFDATVYVKPPFEVKDYKGIPKPNKEIEIKEETVEKVLQQMQEKNAELISYSDEKHKIGKGDVVDANFEGFIDGEPIEGSKGENHMIEVGLGKLINELEEGFLGMKKGEDKDVETTFPEDYHATNLAGKTTLFKVHVNDIKEKNLPELDDEFAKDMGEKFGTLKELKEEIRNNIRSQEEKKFREEIRLDMMDEILKRNPIEELPEIMVESQIKNLKENMASHYRSSGLPDEELEKIMSQENFEERAQRDVAWSLILEQIAEKEKITVTEDEIDKELERRSHEAGMSKEVLKDLYIQQVGSLEPFRQILFNEKILDFLLENAKVTDMDKEGEGKT